MHAPVHEAIIFTDKSPYFADKQTRWHVGVTHMVILTLNG